MKTLDAAFLSALILTLLILIHVATAAPDNLLQNTHLETPTNTTSMETPTNTTSMETPTNTTSMETPTKAVESNKEKSRNTTTEAPPLLGNDASSTPSADVTLSASSSVLQPTALHSTALTDPQDKNTILSSSVSTSSSSVSTSSSSVSTSLPVSTSSSVVPSTRAGSAGELTGGSITIVLLSVILLLILILVAAFKWASHPSNQNSPASHLILGIGPRVRGGVRTLEDRIGFYLCPGGRGESDEEEKVDGWEDEDSSDYSSMGGNDLRQRAQSREEEEKAEDKAKSEEGQEKEKEGKDREREGCEEAIALVSPGSEKSEGEIEESDVTIL